MIEIIVFCRKCGTATSVNIDSPNPWTYLLILLRNDFIGKNWVWNMNGENEFYCPTCWAEKKILEEFNDSTGKEGES